MVKEGKRERRGRDERWKEREKQLAQRNARLSQTHTSSNARQHDEPTHLEGHLHAFAAAALSTLTCKKEPEHAFQNTTSFAEPECLTSCFCICKDLSVHAVSAIICRTSAARRTCGSKSSARARAAAAVVVMEARQRLPHVARPCQVLQPLPPPTPLLPESRVVPCRCMLCHGLGWQQGRAGPQIASD